MADGYRTLRAARDMASIPQAIAVLRIMQAHGINQVSIRDFQTGQLIECCILDRLIEEVESSRRKIHG